ncbi:hypothetical protein SGPA1_30723 [Streptomyces misionensis JCM 4497]
MGRGCGTEAVPTPGDPTQRRGVRVRPHGCYSSRHVWQVNESLRSQPMQSSVPTWYEKIVGAPCGRIGCAAVSNSRGVAPPD